MIATQDLCVSYGAVQAVRGVTLRVRQGEVVSLVGRSGCGKSSVAHAICGFVAHAGVIDAPRRIGVVFQDYALFPFMTCAANIALALHEQPEAARQRRVHECLVLVGMDGLGNRYPWQLSGGQQQRVAVARALAPDPECMVMDEPFAAVDVLLRDALAQWLGSLLSARPRTVLFITHSVEEAVTLSDRVVVMDSGKVMTEVAVPLPRPRQRSMSPDFAAICERLRRTIIDSSIAHMDTAESANTVTTPDSKRNTL